MKIPRGPARQRDRLISASWRGWWVFWYWWKWAGISLPLWARPTAPVRHIDNVPESQKEGELKKPRVEISKDKELCANLPRSKLIKTLPRLDELLCDGTWEDGDAKGDRALMLFVSASGSVRGLVKVQRPPLKLTALGRSIDEALAALDALLHSDDPPWEQDTSENGRPKKGR